LSNSLTFNQMAHWKHAVNQSSQDDKIDEYFECLIDCEDDQNSSRRVCSELLR